MKRYFIILAVLIILTIVLFSFSPFNLDNKSTQEIMKLTSPAFTNNERVPSEYTCQGQDINPQLEISDIPENTQSLVLIVDDPDSPSGTWIHWILFNIPLISAISEDSVPQGAVQGKNSFGENAYNGPCPGSGSHRYFFKLYTLDITLNLNEGATKTQVEQAMQNHILDEAQLVGVYSIP